MTDSLVRRVEAMLHTPAPWRLQFPKDGRKPYEILGPDGELVAVVRIGNVNPPPALCFNGNAKLITRAPRMKAAIVAALDCWNSELALTDAVVAMLRAALSDDEVTP